MEYQELKKLNEKFAEESSEMMNDYIQIFHKWIKKSPRMAIIIMMQLPINVLGQTIEIMPDNLHSQCFPELPDMMYRFMNPFMILREKWGKIPDKEFMKEYKKIYESQYDDWFPSKDEKEKFEEWYKGKNRNL